MKRINKVLLSAFTSVFAIGMFINSSSAYAKTAVEMEINDGQETIQHSGEVQFDKTTKNVSTSENQADKEDKAKLLKDLSSGEEFTFNGEKWIVLNQENGLAMMKKSVEDLKLKDADFDINVPREVVEYFESTYKEQLSKENQNCLESSFGLAEYENKLHLTAYFKKELKLDDHQKIVTSDKAEKEQKHEDKNNQTYTLIAGGILLVIVIAAFAIAMKKKDKKEQNQN